MNFALNIRAAFNGFVVETMNGDSGQIMVFAHFDEAVAWINKNLEALQSTSAPTIEEAENNALATLFPSPND